MGQHFGVVLIKVWDPAQRLRRGVMLSPLEQNTTMGERMLRRSMRMPSDVTSPAVARRLPTNNLSTMYWISVPFRNTWPPHHFSKLR